MSKAYLQTGKIGDVLAILPILRDQYEQNGKPANLIVARDYASVVDGLEYVNPVIFPGEWSNFKSAFKFAKLHFDRVEVPQLHGADMKFERHTPSVFLDAYRRVGYLDRWDTLPLVLPRTSKTQLSGPTIFYADHSQSSPFFFKEDLHRLIQDTFPTHQVMRASGMRLKNLRDFLPIMDACDLIVSVETSFLHLAKATDAPIIAMVADQPDPWHGSPWSSKFAMHCRYGDFESRKTEIVAAMLKAVNKFGITKPEVFSTARPHGYNMASLGGGKFVYRYHPEKNWKTRLAIDDGRNWTQDIAFPPECDGYSTEDARAFEFQGKTHLAYTCSKAVDGHFYCIQAFGPLENIDGQWRITKHIVPKYAGNDFSGMVKNWVPIVRGDRLFFIWGNHKPTMEQVVLEMDGDKVVKEHRSPAPTWQYGGIRGGCVVPYKGQLLRFFHSRTGDTHKPLSFRYYIGASLMEPEPPFKTVMVSSFPILAGNEKFSNCHSWKPNCALPYGAIQDGDSFKVSVGLNDCECGILTLSASELNL